CALPQVSCNRWSSTAGCAQPPASRESAMALHRPVLSRSATTRADYATDTAPYHRSSLAFEAEQTAAPVRQAVSRFGLRCDVEVRRAVRSRGDQGFLREAVCRSRRDEHKGCET